MAYPADPAEAKRICLNTTLHHTTPVHDRLAGSNRTGCISSRVWIQPPVTSMKRVPTGNARRTLDDAHSPPHATIPVHSRPPASLAHSVSPSSGPLVTPRCPSPVPQLDSLPRPLPHAGKYHPRQSRCAGEYSQACDDNLNQHYPIRRSDDPTTPERTIGSPDRCAVKRMKRM
jgi:hypothetical protein